MFSALVSMYSMLSVAFPLLLISTPKVSSVSTVPACPPQEGETWPMHEFCACLWVGEPEDDELNEEDSHPHSLELNSFRISPIRCQCNGNSAGVPVGLCWEGRGDSKAEGEGRE